MTSLSLPRFTRNALAHLLMLAVVMVWGATFVLVKRSLVYIAPQWFNALRMMLAFACLALIYRRQWRQLTRQAWQIGAMAGICLASGYFFQTQGLVYITTTNSAFITSLVVVLVPFLASLPGLRTPGAGVPRWPAWTGALLACLGVVLLTTPAPMQWTRLPATFLANLNRGDWLTLACAMGFALHVITLAHGIRRVRFEQIALLQIGFATLFLTLGALVMQPAAKLGLEFPAAKTLAHVVSLGNVLMNPLVLFALLVTGVLATAVAFTVQTWSQQVIPPTNLAVILTLEPVFAWLTAFVALHERLTLQQSLGAFLVFAGILATEIRPALGRRIADDRA